MHLILYTILFGLLQLSLGNHHPLARLGLIVSLPGIWFFKKHYWAQIKENFTHKSILMICILLALFRAGQFTRKLLKDDIRTEDIAVVYQKSIEALAHGKNPYLEDIDPYPLHYKGDDHYFKRPKYTPLQILTYAPCVLMFGLKGIYVGNFLVYLLLAGFLYHYFKPSGRQYMALVFLLGGEFVFNKLFSKGVNDLLPALLILLGWHKMNVSTKSGGLLGLSFLAKQLPAGIFGLWFLILGKWKNFIISIPVVLILLVPFLVQDLQGSFENLVLFNLIRPVRETSLLLYLPEFWQRIIGLTGMMAAILLPLVYKNKWGLPFFGLTIFILFSKMSPGNYFIWVFPFLIMWLIDDNRELKLSKK